MSDYQLVTKFDTLCIRILCQNCLVSLICEHPELIASGT